jgi:hypothetical protein
MPAFSYARDQNVFAPTAINVTEAPEISAAATEDRVTLTPAKATIHIPWLSETPCESDAPTTTILATDE